jgi:hypothetical protein
MSIAPQMTESKTDRMPIKVCKSTVHESGAFAVRSLTAEDLIGTAGMQAAPAGREMEPSTQS